MSRVKSLLVCLFSFSLPTLAKCLCISFSNSFNIFKPPFPHLLNAEKNFLFSSQVFYITEIYFKTMVPEHLSLDKCLVSRVRIG